MMRRHQGLFEPQLDSVELVVECCRRTLVGPTSVYDLLRLVPAQLQVKIFALPQLMVDPK